MGATQPHDDPGSALPSDSPSHPPTALGFEEWRGAVDQAFVPLAADPLGPLDAARGGGGWRGSLRSRVMGPCSLAQVTGGAALVRRERREISAADPGVLKLSVAVRGRCLVEQGDRRSVLAPGDAVLYDTARPYRLRFEESFSTLVVMFHRDLLPLPASRVAPLLARRIPGGSGPGAALLPMLGALARHDAGPGAPAPHDLFVADAVLGLVSACLVDDAEVPAQDEDARHATYRRVMAFIDAHLAEDLDVVGLAVTHHVSVRYLQKLFADHGGTVSSRVRQRRLERARLELSDPAHGRRSVASIGASCGMPEPSAFARAFKAAWGTSPSEHRPRSSTVAAR